MKKLIIFFIFPIYLFSFPADYWKFCREVRLVKDEYIVARIKRNKSSRLFYFRWTQFINRKLTFLANYDKINYHTTLSKRYHKDEVRIELLSTISLDHGVPYLLIKFVEYLPKEDRIKFKIYYRDEHEDVEVKKVGIWPFQKDDC
jgi:hypothetical protein